MPRQVVDEWRPTVVLAPAHDGECLTDPDYDGPFCCPVGEAEDDRT